MLPDRCLGASLKVERRIKFLKYSPFGSLERVAISIWRNRDSKVLLEERGNLTLAVRLQPITSCNSQIQRFQKNRRDRLSECGSCHITVDMQPANPTHQGCVGLLSRGPSCCTSLSDIEEGHLVLGESIRHVDALPGENAREQFLGVRIGPPGISPALPLASGSVGKVHGSCARSRSERRATRRPISAWLLAESPPSCSTISGRHPMPPAVSASPASRTGSPPVVDAR